MKKLALIVDDSDLFVNIIAAGLRCFARYDTKHITSIEGFLRYIGWNLGDDIEVLAKKLCDYSCLTFDNNFYPEGEIKGAGFLNYVLGPAINRIPKENRPLVVCFAPSSETALVAAEQRLWKEFGIVSFHKVIECTLVGFAACLAEKYHVTLNRETIVSKILGLELNEFQTGSFEHFTPKGALHFDIQSKLGDLDGAFIPKVDGEANQIPFEQVVEIFANAIKIDPKILLERIEKCVDQARRSKEGGVARKERE